MNDEAVYRTAPASPGLLKTAKAALHCFAGYAVRGRHRRRVEISFNSLGVHFCTSKYDYTLSMKGAHCTEHSNSYHLNKFALIGNMYSIRDIEPVSTFNFYLMKGIDKLIE